jgi:pimeloyl-ACP methyl ester carboxylesterase
MTLFVRAGFLPDADPAVVEWIRTRAVAADPKAMLALVRDVGSLDLKALFRSAGVPIRCINSAPRPPVGTKTEVDKNRRYADFDAVVLNGVGHFPMLERPEPFNARLRETLRALAGKR